MSNLFKNETHSGHINAHSSPIHRYYRCFQGKSSILYVLITVLRGDEPHKLADLGISGVFPWLYPNRTEKFGLGASL